MSSLTTADEVIRYFLSQFRVQEPQQYFQETTYIWLLYNILKEQNEHKLKIRILACVGCVDCPAAVREADPGLRPEVRGENEVGGGVERVYYSICRDPSAGTFRRLARTETPLQLSLAWQQGGLAKK